MTDGNKPTVGPSVFIPQKHPELRQLGSKAIQTFLQQREQYLLKAEDAVARGSSCKPVSLENSVDFKLLKALVVFDTFKNVTTVAGLTDDVLLRWLKSQIEEATTIITPEELEGLVKKNVLIKIKEPDPKIRMMSLFMDYYTFLGERNLQHLTENNTKNAVKHVVGLLKPAGFKQKIENDLALEKAELKQDWKGFYAYVIENAVLLEAFYASVVQAATTPKTPQDQPDQKSKDSPRGGSRGRFPRKGRRQPSEEETLPKDHHDGSQDDPTDQEKNPPVGPANPYVPFCLNRETCPGVRHLMRDCGKTSEEKCRELLAERRRKKRQQPPAIKRVRTSGVDTVDVEDTHTVPASNGRIVAVLADSVPVVVSGDYGSDHAALSEHHLVSLQQPIFWSLYCLCKNPFQ